MYLVKLFINSMGYIHTFTHILIFLLPIFAYGQGGSSTSTTSSSSIEVPIPSEKDIQRAQEIINSADGKINDFVNNQADRLLHLAVRLDDYSYAQTLLQDGADLNVRGYLGWTPLHDAAALGNLKMIQLLVEYGANIEEVDHYFRTPLRFAHLNGHWQVVDYLEKLQRLVELTRVGDSKAVKSLIQQGLPVNFCSAYNRTLLHIAVLNEDVRMVATLLGLGARKDFKDITGKTPLHLAVDLKSLATVIVLLNENPEIDIDLVDDFLQTPLHRACFLGNLEIATLLIQTGANPNLFTDDGWSPLALALYSRSYSIVLMLLNHGACLEQATAFDADAPLLTDLIRYAEQNDLDKAYELLLRTYRLFDAARSNDIKAIESILSICGVSMRAILLNIRDENGQTVLHYAARGGHAKIVELFLAQTGSDPLLRDFEGNTPLALAQERNHQAVIDLLGPYDELEPILIEQAIGPTNVDIRACE